MPACYVPGCKIGHILNNQQKKNGMKPLSLFRPPEDMLEKWNTIIQRKDRKLRKQDMVCSLHFREEDINYYYSHIIDGKHVFIKRGYPRLKAGALPCIFNNKNTSKGEKQRCQQADGQKVHTENRNIDHVTNYKRKKKTPLKRKGKRKKTSGVHMKQKSEPAFKEEDACQYADAEETHLFDDELSQCQVEAKIQKNMDRSVQLQYTVESTDMENSVFTYEELITNVCNVELPSTLWAVHRHPQNRFVAYTHTTLDPEKGPRYDKCIKFEGSCTPVIIFHGYRVPIPQLAKDVSSLNDVCKLLSDFEAFRAVCLLTESPHKNVIPLDSPIKVTLQS